MEEYQVYVLSRAAELVDARRLLAGSDSIALAKTATLRKRGLYEVWQGDRWWLGSTINSERGLRFPLNSHSLILEPIGVPAIHLAH